MAKLQVLCGMIASGKSSYCRNAAKAGIVCVNDDAIVNMLHSDDYTLYSEQLKILYKSIENHVVSTAIAMNRMVIVDRGLSMSVRGRSRWIALARSYDICCEAIVFPNEGPLVHARRRADVDARGHNYDYWLKVAKRHHSEWTEPTIDEGFDAIHYTTFDQVKAGKVFH